MADHDRRILERRNCCHLSHNEFVLGQHPIIDRTRKYFAFQFNLPGTSIDNIRVWKANGQRDSWAETRNQLAVIQADRVPVSEMDQILRQYVDKVDGGDMSKVYAAYFEWLDETFRKKEERIGSDLESLKQKNPSDYEKQSAKLEADLLASKREHAAKTAICKDQMTNPSLRETRKNEVVKRIRVEKKAIPSSPVGKQAVKFFISYLTIVIYDWKKVPPQNEK